MRHTLTLALLFVVLSWPAIARSGCDTTCALSDFNRDMLLAYLLDNNIEPLRAGTSPAFFVVTPGGIETRDEALAGVDLLRVSSAEVYTHRIEVTGDTAVLAGKIRANGTLGGRPIPELGFLSVFRNVDGEWLLIARSLVPQGAAAPPATSGN